MIPGNVPTHIPELVFLFVTSFVIVCIVLVIIWVRGGMR